MIPFIVALLVKSPALLAHPYLDRLVVIEPQSSTLYHIQLARLEYQRPGKRLYCLIPYSKNQRSLDSLQLPEVGEDPFLSCKLTRLVGLLQDKLPETEQEWEEVMSAIVR